MLKDEYLFFTERTQMKQSYLNFQVDHMTLLLQPRLYSVAYTIFRTVFGVQAADILYDKRKEWEAGQGEKSMTYALMLGKADETPRELMNTIVAVVQPSEPKSRPSHVRDMLDSHNAAAHWQHIALRTPDLLSFHEHALSLGVNFVTPILNDAAEDLIQVFSGEWFFPGMKSSGMFFEFLERHPGEGTQKKLEEKNRQSWFRDQTFDGLYNEKEREYQSGKVTPFIDFELFEELEKRIGGKSTFELSADDLKDCENIMRNYASKKR
ncbi:MAG: hypothetical protein GY705_08990 [Bacteroidetes bacterium]|jgi:hypothetical protein|nr:hypothetical protein [Bacteroidota bacterium]